MAGLNYFLTHDARNSEGDGVLGEKRDVRVWLGWLELRAHGEVEAIETPLGFIPFYADLKRLFASIDKPYSRDLYEKQFSLYIDNVLARIDLQEEAYRKEQDISPTLFAVYDEQRRGLEALRAEFGSIVSVEQLVSAQQGADR